MELESARDLKQSLIVEREPVAAAATGRVPALGIAPAGGGQYRLAVRVQHPAFLDGADVASLRAASRGEIDVRYVGRVARHHVVEDAPWTRTRQRPVAIGTSVGHYAVTAGTVGAFVARVGDTDRLLLSNNHVLANENRARLADPVLQPGDADGGHRPDDVVGTLDRFVALDPVGVNHVDCALARMNDDVAADPAGLRGLGDLGEVGAPDDADWVVKIGRTTGLTFGTVSAFELDGLYVEYSAATLRFDAQLEVASVSDDPFSRGGDSGSLVVTRDRLRPVGLLFAGSERGGPGDSGLTYANPLTAVLELLDVRFA
jgi:hypothetical protein